MVFNKIEDKLTRLILTVVLGIMLICVGFAMIRFMPPILKLLGVMLDVITVWGFIKYLRSDFLKKKTDKK